MFKYKSPLSRLLEGAGKSKESTESEQDGDAPEPIADLNALRKALAGNTAGEESYEDAEELIPEEKMPEFASDEEPTAEDLQEEASSESVEVVEETDEFSFQPEEDGEDEQVVTLRLTQPEETPSQPEEESAAAEETDLPELEPAAEAPMSEQEEPVESQAPAMQIAEEAHAAEPAPAPQPAQSRRERVKTTFLGFERPDTHVQDLMEAEPAATAPSRQAEFPVGWLVITSGPGRGTSIALTEGLMQIGRNDDQAIQLDFGDHGISRSNHAVIAYDPEDRKCYLGHGGKANLVRLNGGPVLSTVPLSSGDTIRISETSIRFVAFCDGDFDWRDN